MPCPDGIHIARAASSGCHSYSPLCTRNARGNCTHRGHWLQRWALLQEVLFMSGSTQALRPNHLPNSNCPGRQPTRKRAWPGGSRRSAMKRLPDSRRPGPRVSTSGQAVLCPDAHASRLTIGKAAKRRMSTDAISWQATDGDVDTRIYCMKVM